jgi:hypothetical protein
MLDKFRSRRTQLVVIHWGEPTYFIPEVQES